ncbi:MAG: hypothetical protein U5L01_05215, partial [Rheinheimera sp.]|nr:hypothetical protein [Rheinheimera sp.]
LPITQWLRQYGLPTNEQHIWLSLPQGKLALPVSLIQPLIDTIVELLNLQRPVYELELPDYKAAILPPPGAPPKCSASQCQSHRQFDATTA